MAQKQKETGFKDKIKTMRWSWNLPGKLVLAQSQYIASNFRHYLALIFSSAVLQNVLDHIVAVLVLNKTHHTDTFTET